MTLLLLGVATGLRISGLRAEMVGCRLGKHADQHSTQHYHQRINDKCKKSFAQEM
jgi:hypothetical protein